MKNFLLTGQGVICMVKYCQTLWDEILSLPKGKKELLKLKDYIKFNKDSLGTGR